MFIRTQEGNILNTDHFRNFYVKHTGEQKPRIFAERPVKGERRGMDPGCIILTCDNEEVAQRALDTIFAHLVRGDRTWDASNVDKGSGSYIYRGVGGKEQE